MARFVVQSAQKTDSGLERQINEDSCARIEPNEPAAMAARGCLYLVADGMGGQAAGDKASQMAIKTIIREYYGNQNDNVRDALTYAVMQANREIYDFASSNPNLRGMGTTIVAVVLHNGMLYVAHAGDSRAYRLRGNAMSPITEDDSFVATEIRAGRLSPEEASNHQFRNIVTKALGGKAEIMPTVSQHSLLAGDVILLCSDGLHGVVNEQEISRIVADPNPNRANFFLINAAYHNGAPDNVTAVVVRVAQDNRGEGMVARPAPAFSGKLPDGKSANASSVASNKTGIIFVATGLVVFTIAFIIFLLVILLGSNSNTNAANSTLTPSNSNTAAIASTQPNLLPAKTTPSPASTAAPKPSIAPFINKVGPTDLARPVSYTLKDKEDAAKVEKHFKSISPNVTIDKLGNTKPLKAGDAVQVMPDDYYIAYPVVAKAFGESITLDEKIGEKPIKLEMPPSYSKANWLEPNLIGKPVKMILLLDNKYELVQFAFYLANEDTRVWRRYPVNSSNFNDKISPLERSFVYVLINSGTASFVRLNEGKLLEDASLKPTLDTYKDKGMLGVFGLAPADGKLYPQEINQQGWVLQALDGAPTFVQAEDGNSYFDPTPNVTAEITYNVAALPTPNILTPTAIPTNTPVPTATPTSTPIPPTATPRPANTPTPNRGTNPGNGAKPSDTPTTLVTPTAVPPTLTPTIGVTPTAAPIIFAPTATPTATPIPTNTPTPPPPLGDPKGPPGVPPKS